jgi:hypothetical protein
MVLTISTLSCSYVGSEVSSLYVQESGRLADHHSCYPKPHRLTCDLSALVTQPLPLTDATESHNAIKSSKRKRTIKAIDRSHRLHHSCWPLPFSPTARSAHYLPNMPSRLLRLTIAFALSLGSCSSLTSPVERGSNALFDYIVVGGGNAGLTLASRLSENSIVRVAVIEAGTFYERVTGNESIIPGNRGLYEGKAPSITNPLVEWGFMITPQAVRLVRCT